MYFDLEPKSSRADLYDFESPFGKLLELLKDRKARAPLIVVKGVRKIGKTSLVKTALNESGLPYLIIDGRAFADTPIIRKKDLLKEIERKLNETLEKKPFKKFLEILGGVAWLKVDMKPPFVRIEWRKPARELDPLDLVHSFDRLARESRSKFVLTIDETQEFKRLTDYNLPKLMAHIYDYIENVQMIVTGSQVGMLEDFLKLENDAAAPLFGKGTVEINIPRLSPEAAIDFLKKGATQVGISLDTELVELATSKLDGVIGWLTLFGHEIIEGGATKSALARAIEKGEKLEANEVSNFLKARKQARGRYLLILETVARLERARWIDIKENLEVREKKRISDKVFSALLKNLNNADFLAEKGGFYSIPDPMLLGALQKKLVR